MVVLNNFTTSSRIIHQAGVQLMKGDKYPIDETFTRFFECIIKNILRISAQNGTLINDIRNLLAVCIIPTWDQLYELLSLNIEWKMDYYIDIDTFGNQQLREYGYITDWITPTLNYMNEINIYQYDSDKDTSLQTIIMVQFVAHFNQANQSKSLDEEPHILLERIYNGLTPGELIYLYNKLFPMTRVERKNGYKLSIELQE